ncbi:MAG TPA: hypothetical protein VL098_14800 [Flavipsychrobacter sp.]|nr:hypothetical protein [Flavipsychrobacter sp.]
MQKEFTLPKLYDSKGDLSKDGFVGFSFTDSESEARKPFQLRTGIDYYKAKPERYTDDRTAIIIITACFKKGWNPFREKLNDFIAKEEEPDPNNTRLT